MNMFITGMIANISAKRRKKRLDIIYTMTKMTDFVVPIMTMYGQITRLIGRDKNARVVGTVLSRAA